MRVSEDQPAGVRNRAGTLRSCGARTRGNLPSRWDFRNVHGVVHEVVQGVVQGRAGIVAQGAVCAGFGGP